MPLPLLRAGLLVGLLLVLLALPPPLMAQSTAAAPALVLAQVSNQTSGQSGMTLDQAVRLVQKRTGGRVLSARQVRQDGNHWYEIRVLISEGNVRVFRVDPDSGGIR